MQVGPNALKIKEHPRIYARLLKERKDRKSGSAGKARKSESAGGSCNLPSLLLNIAH